VRWHTGDYAVEQTWDQITIKFYNREYFGKFVESLMTRYVALRAWNDPRRQPEGCECLERPSSSAVGLSEPGTTLAVSRKALSVWNDHHPQL